jgi:hypothetical protein
MRSHDTDVLLKCRWVAYWRLDAILWLSDKDFFPNSMIFAEIRVLDDTSRPTQDLSVFISSYHMIAIYAEPDDHTI